MPPPSHWFDFIALHEPMDVQFHCVIEKALVEEEKIVFPIKVSYRRNTNGISKGNTFYILLNTAPSVQE